jgi:DNA replication protein DnaC
MTTNWKSFCEIGQGIPERYRDADIKDFDGPGYRGTIREFADTWIARQRSAVLYGPPGKGKTRGIYALARQTIELSGISETRVFNSTDLDERLLREFNEFGAIDGLMEALCSVKYLFIDDFGTERTSDRVVRNTQFLIDRRWSTRSPLIISTNMLSGEIKDRYGARVFDRLRDADWIDFGCFADWRGYDDNAIANRD